MTVFIKPFNISLKTIFCDFLHAYIQPLALIDNYLFLWSSADNLVLVDISTGNLIIHENVPLIVMPAFKKIKELTGNVYVNSQNNKLYFSHPVFENMPHIYSYDYINNVLSIVNTFDSGCNLYVFKNKYLILRKNYSLYKLNKTTFNIEKTILPETAHVTYLYRVLYGNGSYYRLNLEDDSLVQLNNVSTGVISDFHFEDYFVSYSSYNRKIYLYYLDGNNMKTVTKTLPSYLPDFTYANKIYFDNVILCGRKHGTSEKTLLTLSQCLNDNATYCIVLSPPNISIDTSVKIITGDFFVCQQTSFLDKIPYIKGNIIKEQLILCDMKYLTS